MRQRSFPLPGSEIQHRFTTSDLKNKASTCSQSLIKLVINDHTTATVGLEAASEELSELVIKVSNDFNQMVAAEILTILSYLAELAASISRKQEHFQLSDDFIDVSASY